MQILEDFYLDIKNYIKKLIKRELTDNSIYLLCTLAFLLICAI